jgi:tRNA dimethylallyltransferase
MKPRLIFLVGPTASGKTAASIVLARKIHAQIVSCDSMQVYKGMSILTSKPSRQDRKSVMHHCLDFVPLAIEYNVSQYRSLALKKIRAIIKNCYVPLFVGGTGLYMTVLVDGIFDMKTEDPFVRQRLYRAAKRHGSAQLHKRLEKVDSAAALKIHPNDTRRLVRALEVFEVTGKPITELQKSRKGLAGEFDIKIFCLDVDRAVLYNRINERVDRMFEQGLVDEVRKLAKKKLSKTASAAIGLREVRDYLSGQCSLDEAKEQMKQSTRNYARRQLTWFRKDKRITWIGVADKDTGRDIALKIGKKL